MQRLFAALLALTCVLGSTPSFALVGGHGRGAFRGPPVPQTPAFENRIPAPPPAQAPVINGPLSEPRGM
jgi:hypothetical protein